MNAEYIALAGRIRQSLPDLRRLVARAELLMGKAQQSGDSDYLDGVALNLHSFYTGVERVFEDIARTLDQTVPTGPARHQALLLQMSAEVSTVRPPVIRPETRHCLDEYRGFRHIVRNVYTFNLRPGRLQELVAGLGECFAVVEEDLLALCRFLEGVSAGDIDQ